MSVHGRSLVLITGEKGSGKSTVMTALLPYTPGGAKLDAEDVGQVHPFTFDEQFLDLLWANVVAVISNFWRAGFHTVITGSLLDGDTYSSFQRYRQHLPKDVAIYIVRLTASKAVRDQRRIERTKPSSKEWRDQVDASYPAGDTSLHDESSGYRYITIDNSAQALSHTVAAIQAAIPELYPPERVQR